MKKKKMLATLMTCAFMVGQMVTPVMAADGGEVDVDVSTTDVVIRVAVPTSLEVAVNQFEKGDTGSQIYSTEFGITNKSEIPVKVVVTSKATLDAAKPITLLPTKKAAEDSTVATGEAWLATAALVADGKYIAETGKTIKDLNEASKSVTTFVQGTTDADKKTATAEQTFYLAGPADGATVTYKGFVPSADGKVDGISYAQFYELTKYDLAGADGDAKKKDLQTKVDAGDVYFAASSAVSTSVNGVALTRIAKGSDSTANYADTNTYYTVDTKATAVSGLDAAKVYVYGESTTATTGGTAGFRYIGKLSEAKEVWTETDISSINIKYTITGVTDTKYGEVKNDCTYGLYTPVLEAKPSIETKTYDYDRTADLSITVDLGTGDLAAENITSVAWSAEQAGTYADFAKDSKWTYVDGTLTFKSNTWGSKAVGDKFYLKVTFDDDDTTAVILILTISK